MCIQKVNTQANFNKRYVQKLKNKKEAGGAVGGSPLPEPRSWPPRAPEARAAAPPLSKLQTHVSPSGRLSDKLAYVNVPKLT